MPKLKRRSVGQAVGVTIGSLLADRSKEQADARNAELQRRQDEEYARAKADRDTSSQFAVAKQVALDYQSGTRTYTDAIGQLKTLLESSSDKDFKAQLSSMIDNAGVVKIQRDVAEETQKFNNGLINYSQLESKIGTMAGQNAVLKDGIASTLKNAKSAENVRLQTSLFNEYKNTGDFSSYVRSLTDLKGKQTDPAEIAKIQKDLDGATQEQAALNDNKTYGDYKSGKLGDGQALAYFSARLANAKTSDEAAALTKFVDDIRKNQTAGGAAYQNQIATTQNAMWSKFENQIWSKAITESNGDQNLILQKVDEGLQLMRGFAQEGGPNANEWANVVPQMFKQAGISAAREAYFEQVRTNFDKAYGLADKTDTARAKAGEYAGAAKIINDAIQGKSFDGSPLPVPLTEDMAMQLAGVRDRGPVNDIQKVLETELKNQADARNSRGATVAALYARAQGIVRGPAGNQALKGINLTSLDTFQNSLKSNPNAIGLIVGADSIGKSSPSGSAGADATEISKYNNLFKENSPADWESIFRAYHASAHPTWSPDQIDMVVSKDMDIAQINSSFKKVNIPPTTPSGSDPLDQRFRWNQIVERNTNNIAPVSNYTTKEGAPVVNKDKNFLDIFNSYKGGAGLPAEQNNNAGNGIMDIFNKYKEGDPAAAAKPAQQPITPDIPQGTWSGSEVTGAEGTGSPTPMPKWSDIPGADPNDTNWNLYSDNSPWGSPYNWKVPTDIPGTPEVNVGYKGDTTGITHGV